VNTNEENCLIGNLIHNSGKRIDAVDVLDKAV